MRMGTDSDFRIRTQKFYARMRREPGSGPVKKFIKKLEMRIIPDPDVIRIRELNEKLMRMGPDSVSRIRTQKFYA
jgi:hypothetical protein